MGEVIDIRISRDLFDQYVKEGVLSSDLMCVLEVQDTDILASPKYLEIKRLIYDEYQEFDTIREIHKKKVKELYKQLDELQHGKTGKETI